jgi:outer membrane protein TolC
MAQRVLAEGSLAVSLATYREVIGEPTGAFGEPPLAVELPPDEAETVAASAANPAVIAAEFAEKAARNAIDEAFGALLPSVNLIGELEARDDLLNDERTSLFDEDKTASITARVTIPLYQAGAPDSRVREAKQRAGQRRNEVDAQRRSAARLAESAWRALETARAQKRSFETEVRAADLALKGVRQEAEVGARTVLDILDAEQELLDAQVNLVSSRRDEIVAAYTVLASIGRLTAGHLSLDVTLYDPERHYETVRDKFWGTDTTDE